MVRQAPAVRPPHAGHAVAGAGAGTRGAARSSAPRRSKRRCCGSRRRPTPDRSTARPRVPAPSTGSCSRAPTPSTRSCAGCCRSGDIRALGVRICAVGRPRPSGWPATASRSISSRPSRARKPSWSLASRAERHQRPAFPAAEADIAREVLPEELRKAGADVTEAVAYRTVLADIDAKATRHLSHAARKTVDVVTFTSASTVAFGQIFGAEQAPDLLNATLVACIGPVTAEAAEHPASKRPSCQPRYHPGARRRHRPARRTEPRAFGVNYAHESCPDSPCP